MYIYRIDRKACPSDYYHPISAFFSSQEKAEAFARKRAFTSYRVMKAQLDVYPLKWREV